MIIKELEAICHWYGNQRNLNVKILHSLKTQNARAEKQAAFLAQLPFKTGI